MEFLKVRAVYIGPINPICGFCYGMAPLDGDYAVLFWHAHFTTATEQAARGGNAIEIVVPEDQVSLRERLRRLHALRAAGKLDEIER